jgi:cytoskeletal protein RodZ
MDLLDLALIVLWAAVAVTGVLWWYNSRKKKKAQKIGKAKIGQSKIGPR